MIGGGNTTPKILTLQDWKNRTPSLGQPPFMRPLVPASQEGINLRYDAAQWLGPTYRKTVLYQSYIESPFTGEAAPETITVDKWFAPFSEPVRIKKGLRSAQQQLFTFPSSHVESLSWYNPLSDPQRRKEALRRHSALYDPASILVKTEPDPLIFAEAVQSIGPTFRKTVLYQSYAANPLFTITPNVTVDMWFANLSEPVRKKPALRTSHQQFLTLDTDPDVSFSWIYPFSERARRKSMLHTGSQQ